MHHTHTHRRTHILTENTCAGTEWLWSFPSSTVTLSKLQNQGPPELKSQRTIPAQTCLGSFSLSAWASSLIKWACKRDSQGCTEGLMSCWHGTGTRRGHITSGYRHHGKWSAQILGNGHTTIILHYLAIPELLFNGNRRKSFRAQGNFKNLPGQSSPTLLQPRGPWGEAWDSAILTVNGDAAGIQIVFGETKTLLS